MRILAIETSCDETAAAIVEDQDFKPVVLTNIVTSQLKVHAKTGGVIPNVAARMHAEALPAVLAKATKNQKLNYDAVAVTVGPGLIGCLLQGVSAAKSIALVTGKPFFAINHMEGHIYSAWLAPSKVEGLPPSEFSVINSQFSIPELPALVVIVSGGHTELVLMERHLHYKLLGATRDDAAGEAFDKVARLLDLPYPGGPEIARLAKEAREKDVVPDFKFTRPMLHDKGFDFSFSGLKTAVRTLVEKHRPLSDAMKLMIAREFENTVADVLVEKTVRAVEEFGVATVLVGGGVSANDHIRLLLTEAFAEAGNLSALLMPPKELATDNAIMIALAGYFHAQKGEYIDPAHLTAKGNLRLENRA